MRNVKPSEPQARRGKEEGRNTSTRRIACFQRHLNPQSAGMSLPEFGKKLLGSPPAWAAALVMAGFLSVEKLASMDLRELINSGLPRFIASTAMKVPKSISLASSISWLHRGPKDLHEMIAAADPTGAKVAVIGIGISGVQAMKSCLAEGIIPIGFEADCDIGGFWRFKEETEHPSVYRSTHIDTDRDLNSFADFPWPADRPLLIHNTELTRYLRENIQEFGLEKRILLGARVTFVTPVAHTGKFGANSWVVHYEHMDSHTGEVTSKIQTFDGVLVCTGRHGGGGFIPKYKNQEKFEAAGGVVLHSSQYKYPEKHGLLGKDVVVVGIGNSGADIVTELGMVNGGGITVGGHSMGDNNRTDKTDKKDKKDSHSHSFRERNKKRGQTYLVARSGGWVSRTDHMEVENSAAAGDAVWERDLNVRNPWWHRSETRENEIERSGSQAQLNRHGMKPTHRKAQQHPIASGLAGQVWLGDQLDMGWIRAHRGIDSERGFTEDGTGIWLNDAHGSPMQAPTRCDGVVFATGYRYQAGFVDAQVKVVDMRFEREGNDVPLFKGCLPIGKFTGLGFVNFVQSITFPCAELQCRYLTRVFKGLIATPPAEQQFAEMEETRNALAAQYIDRQQLRVQHGIDARYYDDLCHAIGCKPTFWKLLRERPTAFWHAFCVFGGIAQLPNRLVGPGRLENMEGWIEERYKSRYFGRYKDAGAGFDHNPKKGELKNGDGLGPVNRRSSADGKNGWVAKMVERWQEELKILESW